MNYRAMSDFIRAEGSRESDPLPFGMFDKVALASARIYSASPLGCWGNTGFMKKSNNNRIGISYLPAYMAVALSCKILRFCSSERSSRD